MIFSGCSLKLIYLYFVFVKNILGQFAEDGSFIGQYVPGKLQPPVSPPTPHNMSPHQLQTVSSKQQSQSNGNGIGSNSGAIATYV